MSTTFSPITAAIIEGILLIKTPHLPKRSSKSSLAWEADLQQALAQIDVPIMVQKRIWFLSIYPTNTPPHTIPDHDNQDIKRVIDLITDFTLGGDSAITCALRQDSLLADDLPSGCYVFVSPLKNEPPTLCEALKFISKITENHP